MSRRGPPSHQTPILPWGPPELSRALLHCRGIGRVRLRELQERGIETWEDVLARTEELPRGFREAAVEMARGGQEALERGDIDYFARCLAPQDRWRLLDRFLDQVTFFDIETTGLEIDATITVIGCYHRGDLRVFVEHEDLDDFLDLLDEVELLASFNGSSFDVPRLLSAFHLPSLPCPHLDLRWAMHHLGLRGTQAAIEEHLQEPPRPRDVASVDGARAVLLWEDWIDRQRAEARQTLLRYCGADVLSLVRLAHRLVGRAPPQAEDLWAMLPDQPPTIAETSPQPQESVRDRVAALRARLRKGGGP